MSDEHLSPLDIGHQLKTISQRLEALEQAVRDIEDMLVVVVERLRRIEEQRRWEPWGTYPIL